MFIASFVYSEGKFRRSVWGLNYMEVGSGMREVGMGRSVGSCIFRYRFYIVGSSGFSNIELVGDKGFGILGVYVFRLFRF